MLKNLHIKNLIFGLILAVTAVPVPSALAYPRSSTSCTSYIRGMFEGFSGYRYKEGYSFKVKGTRITARGKDGFSSFAMNQRYSTREGLSSTNSSRKQGFTMYPVSRGGSLIQGKFQDVFPGRRDGKSDLTTLQVYRNGLVQIVLNSWGNTRVNLRNLACYRGHQGINFVLTGQNRTSSHGFDFWTFLITPEKNMRNLRSKTNKIPLRPQPYTSRIRVIPSQIKTR